MHSLVSKQDSLGQSGSNAAIPLVVILGPTAVGKTKTAIQLAERFEGEIVSADSRLLYRGMDIGTAKPSFEERSRVPHHLIDVADPDQVWSLAMFQRAANQVILETSGQGKLPLLVGGTGQYIRAVVDSWVIPETKPDFRLRKAIENWSQLTGALGLHRRLAVIDPQAASIIEPNNRRRTVRALEVIFSTGERFSTQRRAGVTPYRVLVIGLHRPRQVLYGRVDRRIENMFALGFIDEVKNLLDAGYSPELPAMSAIGYRQVTAYLQGEISLEKALQEIKRGTRVFVRRQANWFKLDDPQIHWYNLENRTAADIGDEIQVWLELQQE